MSRIEKLKVFCNVNGALRRALQAVMCSGSHELIMPLQQGTCFGKNSSLEGHEVQTYYVTTPVEKLKHMLESRTTHRAKQITFMKDASLIKHPHLPKSRAAAHMRMR